jgi:hypothetical protein
MKLTEELQVIITFWLRLEWNEYSVCLANKNHLIEMKHFDAVFAAEKWRVPWKSLVKGSFFKRKSILR